MEPENEYYNSKKLNAFLKKFIRQFEQFALIITNFNNGQYMLQLQQLTEKFKQTILITTPFDFIISWNKLTNVLSKFLSEYLSRIAVNIDGALCNYIQVKKDLQSLYSNLSKL